MDQCWVGPVEESVIKIVNFGQKSAYQLDGFQFQGLLEEIEKRVSIFGLLKSENSFETLVHCSAVSTSIVLNVKTQQARFCVWAKLAHDELEILTLGVEPMEHQGHCSGAALGQGLITLASPEKLPMLTTWLYEQGLITSGDQIRVVNERLVAVQFEEKFFFQEQQVFDLMEQELVAAGVIKFAELNWYPYQNGEFLLMQELGGEF